MTYSKVENLDLKLNKHFCPVIKISEILGNMWVILIIHELQTESKRFGQIQSAIEGLNSRTLTEKLKMLESKGIITREVFNEIPLRVEYSLTEMGQSISKIVEQMVVFGKEHEEWLKHNCGENSENS